MVSTGRTETSRNSTNCLHRAQLPDWGSNHSRKTGDGRFPNTDVRQVEERCIPSQDTTPGTGIHSAHPDRQIEER